MKRFALFALFVLLLINCSTSRYYTDTYTITTRDGQKHIIIFESWDSPVEMDSYVQEWFVLQKGLSVQDVVSFELTDRKITRKKPEKN